LTSVVGIWIHPQREFDYGKSEEGEERTGMENERG